jgi:hypothetical protein
MMRRRFTFLLAFTLLLLPGSSAPLFAQRPGEGDEPDLSGVYARVNSLLQNLGAEPGSAEKTLTKFVEGSPLARDEKAIQDLAAKIKMFDATYGRFVASERISTKHIGDDVLALRYLYKAEQYRVVWYFTFYRPRTSATDTRDWTLIAVRFDTRVENAGM